MVPKPKPKREATVQRVAKTPRLGHLLDRNPGQLSGGHRQRLAMASGIERGGMVLPRKRAPRESQIPHASVPAPWMLGALAWLIEQSADAPMALFRPGAWAAAPPGPLLG